MNLAEKLAGTYLRLNGFLTLLHFTAFDGNQHNHIDLVALRAPKSQEVVGNTTLLTDDLLFDTFSALIGRPSRTVALGVAAEVRTNVDRDEPSEAHINYVGQFLGGIPVTRLAFYEGSHSVIQNGQTLDIGVRYAGLWIQRRIDWMHEHKFKLSKTGSWNLSEGFLSDFLALRKFGLLTSDRNS
jgi:hypothetical protein